MASIRRSWLEWAVLALSAVAITAVVGYLVFDAVAGDRSPANPTVTLREAEARSTALGWVIPATVRNDGGTAAETVVVEATAMVAGTEETSELEIDFLPAGTEVAVEFGFSDRPDGKIEVRLVGSRRP